MKDFKNLFTFTIPLVVVLLSFSIYIISSKTKDNYIKKINNDYFIIIVSSTPFGQYDIKTLDNIDVLTMKIIQRDKILGQLKGKLSQNTLELLQEKLPYFYRIYLKKFPSQQQLKNITKQLNKFPNITRVETFAKNHNTLYTLLLMINIITLSIFFISLVFALLILSKQIKIWIYQNRQQIYIMQLHGASVVQSIKSVIKISCISSFIAIIVSYIIITLFIYNIDLLLTKDILVELNIDFNFGYDFAYLVFLSFLISILSILGILFKQKRF